ncbi:MAG: CoA transferase, partial [Actinobacteria bacterium]
MPGPLEGVKVIELAGLGPAPFCGMVLADLGAEVVRIDRSTPGRMGFLPDPAHDVHGRGKKSLIVDLKHEDGPGIVLDLVATSDALIAGFRQGVA